MKLCDIFVILENREQMVRAYVKTNIFDDSDVSIIDSITHGDAYTKLVSDAYYYFGDRYSKMVTPKKLSENEIILLNEFHQNLIEYNKNVLPLTDLFATGKYSHPLDTINRLNTRKIIIDKLKQFPSIYLRNLRGDIRKERNTQEFDQLFSTIKHIISNLRLLNKLSEEKREKIYKKIFSSVFTTFDEVKNRFEQITIPYLTEDTPISDIINKVKEMGDEAEILYKKNNILVVVTKTYEAMSYIGCSAQWCFVNTESHFNEYSDEGFPIIVFNLNEEPSEPTRMVVVLANGSVYDMYNEYMEDGDIYLDKIKVAKIIYSYDYSKENNQLSLAEIYGV